MEPAGNTFRSKKKKIHSQAEADHGETDELAAAAAQEQQAFATPGCNAARRSDRPVPWRRELKRRAVNPKQSSTKQSSN